MTRRHVGSSRPGGGEHELHADAIAAAVSASRLGLAANAPPPERVADGALALAARARSLPEHVSTAVDVLTIAAGLLADAQLTGEADALVEEANLRLIHVMRPLLAPGQLAVVHIDVALRRGNWDEARDVLAAVLARIDDAVDSSTYVTLRAQQSWLAAVSGDLAGADRLLDDVAAGAAQAAEAPAGDAARPMRYPGHATDALPVARAEIARQRSGARAALAVVEHSLESSRYAASLHLHALRIDLLAELSPAVDGAMVNVSGAAGARAARLAGNTPSAHGSAAIDRVNEALAAFDVLVRRRTVAPNEESAWVAARAAAAIGDGERAAQLYEAVASAGASPFVVGSCLLHLARIRSDLRDRQDALRLFDRARTVFSSIGAETYAERAASLAAELGER